MTWTMSNTSATTLESTLNPSPIYMEVKRKADKVKYRLVPLSRGSATNYAVQQLEINGQMALMAAGLMVSRFAFGKRPSL